MGGPEMAAEVAAEARVAELVARQLGVRTSEVTVEEISELSNINYVYRVETPERSLYVKVVPEKTKRLAVPLPRERIVSEAAAIARFHALAGDEVAIPEVLFVDRELMALGMSDVGIGREVLFRLLPAGLELLAEQAESLGRALGRVHGGTRGEASPRPAAEEAIIRRVIFDGLMAPGARQLFPECADEALGEMQVSSSCLVHADLWSKNLLVRRGEPLAVVDFEGAFVGDPAFDLGTLLAVALVPAVEQPGLSAGALGFGSQLLASWSAACGDRSWPTEVLPRTFRATATFLAARGFGPFAYELTEPARGRLARLAREIAFDPPRDWAPFRALVAAHLEGA